MSTWERSTGSNGAGYQPHLDGVRAVAVYLVVAFHAGVHRFQGGFIGVDVFFVLSGYLVTRTLLARRDTTGAIGFKHFYARRVRRLLPAAAVNLVATAFVFRWLATPAESDTAVRSIRAAALYVSNWWFIREDADYFGTAIESSPVLHYWSLSVEEQFYVVWPLALAGLLWLASRWNDRRARQLTAGAVVVCGLVSLAAALSLEGTDLTRAYYGSDTRAYQLLAGACLALVPGILTRASRLPGAKALLPVATAGALGAIVLVGTSLVDQPPVRRGAITTVLTLVLLVSLHPNAPNPVRRMLSLAPVTYLGRISYGTYLWHWIVALVCLRELELAPLPTAVVTAVVASAIAALSFELLEQPIRTGSWAPRLDGPVVACGVAVSLVVGLLIVPRVLDDTSTVSVAAGSQSSGTPVDVDLASAVEAADRAYFDCPIDTGDPCVVHEGTGPRVHIVGDSHALMLAPAFAAAARGTDLHVTVSAMRFCPWLRGMAYFWPDPDRCYGLQDRVLVDSMEEVDPDLVVLAHRSVDDPANPMEMLHPERGVLQPGTERQELVAAALRGVVADLREDGRRVLLIEPTPLPSPLTSMLECLSGASYLEECRRVAEVGPTPEEAVMRAIDSEQDDVWSLDLDGLACPYLPICDPVVDGVVVSLDGSHLTSTYAATMGDDIVRFLEANEVLDGIGSA